MKSYRNLLLVLSLAGLVAPCWGQDKRPDAKNQLPHTKLTPAKITPDLCGLTYRVSTSSAGCQAHFDQGLAYYYSYVWMEAARSFETATRCDPNCAMAW